MPAPATQNPNVKAEESKSKKKKQQAKAAGEAPSTQAAPVEAAEGEKGENPGESSYVKDLKKSIRNTNKKIFNASKVDSVLADNPGVSLDQLVASRKINADQKAQILNKPTLAAALKQYQEQLFQFEKFDEEKKSDLAKQKAEFEKSHTDRAAKELKEAVNAAKKEAIEEAKKEQKDALLLVSMFLRLAAERRQTEDADPESDENMAIEGVLNKLYTGDQTAVVAMTKLVQGVEENTVSINNDTLHTTFAAIKEIIGSQASSSADADFDSSEPSDNPIGTDPTIANAGLTEIDDLTVTALTNGNAQSFAPEHDVTGTHVTSSEGGTALPVDNDLSTSQEWVEVPSVTSTPVAEPTQTPDKQSWADDQPDSPTELSNPAASHDGFHEVQRSSRNAGRGDGQQRGGRGGGRGGRGRGNGQRGRGQGAPRGAPRGGQRGNDA